MSYNDTWDNKRVITGWALAAGVTVAITAAITVGATLADGRGVERDRDATAALVECAKTDRTAADCRVLIYGSR